MSATYSKPTGATDCFAALGAVSSSLCPPKIKAVLSEARMLLMSEEDSANPGQPKYKPATMDAAGFAAVIDNAGAGMKQIYGMGSMPRAADNAVTISGQKIMIQKPRDLDFFVHDFNDDINTFFRTIQSSGGWSGFIWAVTKGNAMIGASPTYMNGIYCHAYYCEDEYPSGDDAIANWNIKFQFHDIVSPPVMLNSPLTVPN